MKNVVVAGLLVSLAMIANAQTVTDQVAGLKKAGIQEVEAGVFARGNIAILVKPDGTLTPYVPFESGLVPKTITALRKTRLASVLKKVMSVETKF